MTTLATATRSRVDTVIGILSGAIEARLNCIHVGNTEWLAKHTDVIEQLAKDILPSGSGIDRGTTVDLDQSRTDRIVLRFSFHHMDQHGYYAGWSDYSAIVKPAFRGLNITITGRDRNGIKDYLYQTFDHILTHQVCQTFDVDTERTTFDLVLA